MVLVNDLALLFSVDALTYSQALESAILMEAAALETKLHITLATWEYRTMLVQAARKGDNNATRSIWLRDDRRYHDEPVS
jgi:hypothetical protein